MRDEPPQDRRTFAGAWDEIGFYYDKLLYWLYQREDQERARPYAERLGQLLPDTDPNHEAIFGEECWSLVHEAMGDLPAAIEHRQKEIDLIKQLRRKAQGQPWADKALKNYGPDDLSDRWDLLAILYHDKGDLDKALDALQESRAICQRHGIPFDGQDLLEDYLGEREIGVSSSFE